MILNNLFPAEKILDVLKVQIFPSTECVEVNDAFVKALFRFGVSSFQQALQGQPFAVKQTSKSSKHDPVFSHFTLQNAEGFENDSPLNEFDRAVLGILISEFLAGNHFSTVNIIFRALIGKVGDQNVRPMKNQKSAIFNSIFKLMGTVVDFKNLSDVLKGLHYSDKDGNFISLRSSNLISIDILDAKVNGQILNDVIFFKDNSPLFLIADSKNQIVRYPHYLLDVPNLNNTPRIISIKKYVLRRICEIKLHKMTTTITFDDVFSKCRLLDCPRNVKMDARNSIINLFHHLQEKNFIASFELVLQRQKFVAVKFSF